ncbi:hypothetical protein DRP77_01195 [Candidatus Poribacteria bacterium]|nr:MAG: hypothetical protein DRP77_01195 [Candidatus Poribacteria bacterium]
MRGKALFGVLSLLLVASLLTLMVNAQVRERVRPPQPPPGQGVPPEERFKRAFERALDRLKLTEDQKKAVMELVNAKLEASRKAREEVRELRRLARDRSAPEEELRKALMEFRKRRLQERKRILDMEEKLIEGLPARAALQLTVIGVLENGLPFPPQLGGPLRRLRFQRERQRPGR